MPANIETVRNAARQNRVQLLARRNVVASGVGYKVTGGETTSDLSLVCSVTKKQRATELAAEDRVPATVDGIPTDVVETGPIRALQSRTERHRPAPGGVSIGHVDITAGTLGCLVRRGGETFILSNNHVLANSNDAAAGDAIVQPGRADGGAFPADHIATLEDFVPIKFNQPSPPSDCQFARAVIAALNAGCSAIGSKTRYQIVRIQQEENLVDAAIARPLEPGLVSKQILEIGAPAGAAEGSLGLAIKKSGRTTGFTTGVIQQIDVTVNVQYGAGRVAMFSDQLLAGAMSQGGDSGSAVLDDDNRLVGLLFAGSDTTTIINRIQHVFSALGVGL